MIWRGFNNLIVVSISATERGWSMLLWFSFSNRFCEKVIETRGLVLSVNFESDDEVYQWLLQTLCTSFRWFQNSWLPLWFTKSWMFDLRASPRSTIKFWIFSNKILHTMKLNQHKAETMGCLKLLRSCASCPFVLPRNPENLPLIISGILGRKF